MEKYPKTFNKASQPEYRVTMTTKLKKEKPSSSYKVAEKMPMVETAWNTQIYNYQKGIQRELSMAPAKP